MEWVAGIAVVVVLVVVLRAVLRYAIGKMAAARARYNLELDREILRNLKAEIDKAREEGRL